MGNRNSGEFGAELGLGDLPEDITRERLRVSDVTGLRSRTSTRKDALSDLKYQDKVKKSPTQSGTVPYSGEVISTFESRPINAIDFTSTSYEAWPLTATSTDSTTVSSIFSPPGGYITVLRGYRFVMQPIVPIDFDDLLLDLFVNDVSQLGYRSLMHGQNVKDYVPCFVLADAGQNIKITLTAASGVNGVMGDSRNVLIEMYGNLLQVTGAPLQLEIANKEIGLPVKTAKPSGRSPALRSFLRSRQFSRRFRFF